MKLNYPQDLPVVNKKTTIIQAIKDNQVVIVAGETGSGKTTQLPKMCLEALPKSTLRIGCTQPRRIAASSVSARVREELGPLQYLVGYKIRFQDRTSDKTRIKFMTDGVLLAETRNDKLLSQYGVLIIDEAHERSLNIDFLLGYLKTLLPKRPDLKLIITSATIDTEAFAQHFNNAPIISVTGRNHPVEIHYRPIEEKENEELEGGVEHTVSVIDEIFTIRPEGDILVFLPTEQDIRECCGLLENRHQATTVLPLFGRLAAADQAKIFRPAQGIKIIVATNVAETSITVPGIRYVVDSGYARISQYNVRAKTTALPISKISQASASQRTGRAGRIGPGTCYRLYEEEDFLAREEFTVPEIKRANLAEVILQMALLKLGDPNEFPFLDPPHPSAIREGYNLLRELGAIRQTSTLTRRGHIMAQLPVDPCISRILLEAEKNKSLTEVTIICAVLAIQDPRIRPAEQEQQADEAHKIFHHPYSDFLSLLKIWQDFHDGNQTSRSWSRLKKYCKTHFLSFQRMREWFDLQEQLFRLLTKEKKANFVFNSTAATYEQIHRSILSGFLRNIAKKKEEEKVFSRKTGTMIKNRSTLRVFQASQNKELAIFPGSGLFSKPPEWILAANFMETSRLYALTVAAIEPEWIEQVAGDLCSYSWTEPVWHKKSGQVLAKETVSLFGLILSADRKVNFGKRNKGNIPEARNIFIQQGLITGEINGNYSFLQHNLALLKKWKQSEAQLRVRNLLVDDQTLAHFYEQKLPKDIYDQRQLNRFLKKRKSQDFLKMKEEDILARDFEEKELVDFPKERTIAGLNIRLEYTFEPGSEKDGITFRLPAQFATNVSAHHFEWLVPGLLREKIAFLLKSLVKSLRKNFVPVQQSVDRIVDDIEFGKGNLFAAIEASILKQFRISIHRNDWKTDFPPHLTPRFLLFDDNDKEVNAGRDLNLLLQSAQHSLASQRVKNIRLTEKSPLLTEWRGKEQNTWDFDELPQKVPSYTTAGELSGFFYPALHINRQKGCVVVQFERIWQKSAELNKQATLYLFSQQFKEQLKPLKRMISTSFSGPSTLFFGKLKKTKSEITELLLTQILQQIYGELTGELASNKEFFQRVDTIRKEGFYKRGQQEWNQFMAALRKRRELVSQFNNLATKSKETGHFHKEGFARLTQELQEVFPPELLYQNPDYQNISRQLEYLSIRLERFYVNPRKDEQKQEQTAPFTIKLHSLNNTPLPPEAREELHKYREMLIEFKISVFAPEIKRRFSVSPEKLQRQWEEIIKHNIPAALCNNEKI